MKKYQVFIPEWLDDYIKHAAEYYDLSISEILRLELCFGALCAVTSLYSEYKPEISVNDFMENLRQHQKGKLEREDLLRLCSKVYFETRKAIEYRYKKEESGKK